MYNRDKGQIADWEALERRAYEISRDWFISRLQADDIPRQKEIRDIMNAIAMYLATFNEEFFNKFMGAKKEEKNTQHNPSRTDNSSEGSDDWKFE